MNGKGQFAVIVAVGSAAFSGGVALGHILAQKRVQKEIDAELNKIWHENLGKIDKVTKTENGIEMTGTLNTNNPVGARVAEALKEPEFRKIRTGRLMSFGPAVDGLGEITSVTPVESETPQESVNIFDNDIPGWDYQAELNAREGQQIYTITYDEFFGNEMEFKQAQLDYYKGDDMMCESGGKPIYNYSQFVGNKLNFGHGSKDPNVVFIRNEKERMEWEICLDVGRYEEEVLGLTVEQDYEEQDLKHSIRRFQME